MKKRWIIIISVISVVVLITLFLLITGRARTDVYLKNFELSNDGKTMILNVDVSSSFGYVRKMKRTSGSTNYYFTFYSTFGINSKLGVKNSFEITLDDNVDEIYFYKGNKGYRQVLKKDENNKWTIYQEENEQEELLNCLENELGAHIVSEKDNMIPIELKDISSMQDKVEYFKGFYTEKIENDKNMYMIAKWKDYVFDSEVIKEFEKYILKNYSKIYQSYEIDYKGISIFIYNKHNDVNFEEITNKCIAKNKPLKSKNIPSKEVDKLNETRKIIIKTSKNELGTITDTTKITTILNAISSSKRYGDNYYTDGHAFDLEMYDSNNKLIDTVYVWSDGKRICPESMGSGYYTISNDLDLRKIIEEETNYIFYSITDLREEETQKEQLIYQDDKNSYYLKSNDINDILINFWLNNQTMTLKYALDNNYIDIERVYEIYKDLFVKKN